MSDSKPQNKKELKEALVAVVLGAKEVSLPVGYYGGRASKSTLRKTLERAEVKLLGPSPDIDESLRAIHAAKDLLSALERDRGAMRIGVAKELRRHFWLRESKQVHSDGVEPCTWDDVAADVQRDYLARAAAILGTQEKP